MVSWMIRGRRQLLLSGLALWAFSWLPGAAEASIIAGGGSRKTDCLAVFETPVELPGNKRTIVCVDGDSSCDADGAVNGRCGFDLKTCINSGFEPRCTLSGVESVFVDHSIDNGDPKFDPDFQALQDRIDGELDLDDDAFQCTGDVTVQVVLKGPLPGDRCRSGKKRVRMTAYSDYDVAAGKSFVDKNTVKLVCKPAPNGCVPRDLFSSTYDRIQNQIFNQSCAISACHDSESGAGGLLLEGGASYSSLVGATPSNGTAAGLGWLLVKPSDAEESFLYHKIEGSLGQGLGDRMPRGRPKLKGFLRDIIELWIQDGAPDTGWVPGTD